MSTRSGQGRIDCADCMACTVRVYQSGYWTQIIGAESVRSVFGSLENLENLSPEIYAFTNRVAEATNEKCFSPSRL